MSPRILAQASILGTITLLGCRSEEWSLDLTSSAATPLVIKQVKARRNLTAALGPGAQELSSSAPKNSVGFEMQVEVKAGFVAGSVLATRSACRVGDRVWITPYTGDASFHDASAGQTRTSFASQFMPNVFAGGPPTACDVRAQVQPGIVGPNAPKFDAIGVAHICWTADKGLFDGACTSADLPRNVPSSQLQTVGLQAAWSEEDARVGALRIMVGIGVGEGLTATSVSGAAMCSDGKSPPRQTRIGLLSSRFDQYEPGDTFVVHGEGFRKAPKLGASPRCTITVRYATDGKTDAWTDLSSHCLADGKVTDGACEGLAPGPVTLRMEDDHRVFLERGAHREGPFAIGLDPSKEAWAPVIASIAASDDDGVVLSLPSTVAQATVIELTDLLRATSRKIAIKPR